MIVKKAEYVDVMIYAEGTYPYVRGGVSSWIHQIISNLQHLRFGICFIGSSEQDYEGIRYELPQNVVHLETHYMFEDQRQEVFEVPKRSKEVIKTVEILHKWFESSGCEPLPPKLQNISFYLDEASKDYFLHHPHVWDFITRQYDKNCSDIPFVDYFWAVRNMHQPIWLIAGIVKDLPKCGLHHSPSTGYAGFLGALASYHQKRPFYISEHGIYTRERKIDLLNAEWISYKKPLLLKTADEFNYIKQMWINFFTKIGTFAYHKADRIFSLFPQIQPIQQKLGAPKEKLEVLPNGVDVDRLRKLYKKRPSFVPKVITLIGRVVTIKDIKTFIRAMKIVVGRMPEVEGWIVGPMDEDPEYVEECKNMVSALGLDQNVKFLGFQNIADILPKTGIQTLTSISEGMPLVILEGFAAGVPCVATDVGSCRNLIEGALNEEDIAIGHAGIVTGIANPLELADAYVTLLSDVSLWERMQQSAMMRVERFYRQEIFLKRYEMYYEKALNGWRE